MLHATFFDTVVAVVPGVAAAGRRRGGRARASTCGSSTTTTSGITTDEVTEDAHLAARPGGVRRGRRGGHGPRRRRCGTWRPSRTGEALPQAWRRTSAYLEHPVFHEHRSETEMLRYLRRLAGYDVALDRSMIPLGSCTMKLNATTEMEPISWPGFASIHPFAPARAVARVRAS